jgi:hypothetical protein
MVRALARDRLIDEGCPSCDCGVSLASSLYLTDPPVKSCALCSRLAGEHVFHPIAEFGWHVYEDRLPGLQSECLAAMNRRLLAAVLTTAPLDELRAKLPEPDGLRCSRARLDSSPLPGTALAVVEMLQPLREEADDRLHVENRTPRPARPRREPEIVGPTSLFCDTSRPPMDYDWGETYQVGDRIVHPKFGWCCVITVDGRSVVVATSDQDRVLVHRRLVAVRDDLVELVCEWGDPITPEMAAAYCEISLEEAARQLNAMVRYGIACRAGRAYNHCPRKEAA